MITTEEFDEILWEILEDVSNDTVLAIPGVYEIVSEYFNNDVISEFEARQEENKEC